MPYYVYRPDSNNFTGIGFSPADSERVVQVHDTDKPLVNTWKTPLAYLFDENLEMEGDFPSLSNYWRVPVMSQRAWEALRPIIGYCCETLPIIYPTGNPYFIIHVMDTVDGLDCDKSKVTRNATTGRVNRVFRYALKHEILHGKHIFKLPRESGGELLVDEEFRRVVEGNGLKGLQFRQILEE